MKQTTPADVFAIDLEPGKSVMAVMNETGDKRTFWDKNIAVEVEAAKKEFKHFKDAGYMAYKVKAGSENKGEILHEFDPNAERIIFAPPMRGGHA